MFFSLNTSSTAITIRVGYLLCDFLFHNSVVFSVLRILIAISRHVALSGTYEVNVWVNAWVINYCLICHASEGTSWIWIPRWMSLNKIKIVVEPTAQLLFRLQPLHLFPSTQTNHSFRCRQGKKKKHTSFGEYSLHLYTHANKINIWNFLLLI